MTNMIEILKNAFSEIKKYHGDTFVIKCNGAVLEDKDLLKAFCEDIVSLRNAGINVIVVHDGSNIVNSLIKKFSLKGGSANISIPDQTSVELVEMILSGHVNKNIVSQINLAGGSAIGISGKDSHFMVAKRSTIARYEYDNNNKILNFGFLGELALMNPDILLLMEDSEIIPIISPIAIGEDNRTYKIDANDIAGAIAAVLSATKLIFISDIAGIKDSKGNLQREISFEKISKFLNSEAKDNPLYNELRAIFMAFEQATEMAHIIDGNIPHALMLELFSNEEIGTKIKL